ncbi:hypothetical protein ACN28S_10085 [Cystobacter fuscus]
MSVPIRDVLVVHPNAGRRAALASALPWHRVVTVESKLEAADQMANAAPSLIIAPPDDARLFLRRWPTRPPMPCASSSAPSRTPWGWRS